MNQLDVIAERIAQAVDEIGSGSPTDAMRTLTGVCKTKWDTNIELKGIHVSCTRAELTLRFIELAQRDMQLFQLPSAQRNLAEAARLAKRSVALEKVEPWK